MTTTAQPETRNPPLGRRRAWGNFEAGSVHNNSDIAAKTQAKVNSRLPSTLSRMTDARCGCRPRCVGVVADYAEAMLDGATFPAIVVYHDGAAYWPADGFHRIEASKKAGKMSILAEVRQGNKPDAMLAAVGVNAIHGLRRTQADKRRSVLAMLAIQTGRSSGPGDRQAMCGGSPQDCREHQARDHRRWGNRRQIDKCTCSARERGNPHRRRLDG